MVIKKRIGILTTHRVPNYGSLLQSYALQSYLISLGYDVELIDYNFPTSLHVPENTKDKEKQSIKDLLIKAIFGCALFKQKKQYISFLKNRLKLSQSFYPDQTSILKNPPKYDIYMVGSDQVWNPRYTNYDPIFLLSFVKTGVRCSFASSLGVNTLDLKQEDLFKTHLSKFKQVSVREKSSVNVLKRIGVNNITNCIDPTLLLSRKDWQPLIKKTTSRKFILCYFLNYTFDAHPFVDDLAKSISKQTGFEIIRVARPPKSLFNKNTKYKISASTEEFLGLIDDAELVLTTSFHGTLFSLNFKKPFYSIVKDVNDNDARIIDLLNSLNLSNRLLDIKSELPKNNLLDIDYNEVTNKMEELISSSKKYLENLLNNG